jgi:hypothetical protein
MCDPDDLSKSGLSIIPPPVRVQRGRGRISGSSDPLHQGSMALGMLTSSAVSDWSTRHRYGANP